MNTADFLRRLSEKRSFWLTVIRTEWILLAVLLSTGAVRWLQGDYSTTGTEPAAVYVLTEKGISPPATGKDNSETDYFLTASAPPVFPGRAVSTADNRSSPEPPENRESLRSEALKHLEEGNHEAAFALLLRYTGIRENSSEALSLRRRMFSDHTAERIRSLFHGEIFTPRDAESAQSDPAGDAALASQYIQEGIISFEKENFREALSKFRKASGFSPQNYRAYYLSARAEAALNNHGAAVNLYNTALRYAPGNADIHFYKGISLYYQGNYSSAADSFRSACALDPDYAEAWFNLGSALRELGQYIEAAEAYEKSFRLQPAYTQAAERAASVYEAAGLSGKASEMQSPVRHHQDPGDP